MLENYDSDDVFIGVDIGKGEHHAVALDRLGKQLFDKVLPNEEAKLRALIGQLKRHGRVLFVVDQPATIGALPIAVAQAANAPVGCSQGTAIQSIADLRGRSQFVSSSPWSVARSPLTGALSHRHDHAAVALASPVPTITPGAREVHGHHGLDEPSCVLG
jgi:hypothetical protein